MANKSRIVTLGKRVVNKINTSTSSPPSLSFSLFRSVHASAYDKNIDEYVRPAVVPDEVIKPESDRYWAPHPQTGVFGPATDQNSGAATGGALSAANGGQSSLLEEKAWFRPTSLEDMEKPHHV